MPAQIKSLHAEKRRRLPTEQRRQEIVAAIVRLALELGPEAVTTAAIAERIGLTHGALFRHFADKEAMWAAVIDWMGENLGAAVEEGFHEAATPLATLERVFLAHVGFVARHPGVPRILYHELQRPADSAFRQRVRRMVSAYRQRLCQLVAAAKAAGELPGCLDEETAAVLIIGTVQGLVVQSSLFRGEASMVAAAKRLFPLLLSGLRGAKP